MATRYTPSELNYEARRTAAQLTREGQRCASCDSAWLPRKATWELHLERDACPTLRIIVACKNNHTAFTSTAI